MVRKVRREHISIMLSVAAVMLTKAGGERPPPARATLVPSHQEIRATRQLCEELNPPGYEHPQRTRSPYLVSVEWDDVPDVNIYVDSPYSMSYEGLIVQMRSGITGEPIGSMSGHGLEATVQSVTCVQHQDTAYLASRRWRQSETVYWYAPAGFNRSSQPIVLLATVALGPFVFWQHEVRVPLCTQDPYVFEENETIIPLKSRKLRSTSKNRPYKNYEDQNFINEYK